VLHVHGQRPALGVGGVQGAAGRDRQALPGCRHSAAVSERGAVHSHGGSVSYTGRRAQDLLEFCTEQKLPYGDVYRTLDLLDPQRTSVWADTIHPTNDGSIIAVHALRYLLRQMGATGNPYSVHGYRAPDAALPDPRDPALQPITTAQPRRDRDNKYGLIAAADGKSLTSTTPLVFKVGVGPLRRLESFDVEVTLGAPGQVHIYDWAEGAWIPVAQAPDVPPRNCVHKRSIWVGVSGEAPAVDYLAVTLTGDVRPWQPRTRDRAILWPPEGQFEWAEAGNLLPNADLKQADGDAPAGWTSEGDGSLYLPEGVICSGTGEFGGPRGDQFTCTGAQFTQTVRPLDMLVVDAELQDGGNFLVERVIDDETLDLRRSPKAEAGSVSFEVRRWSGLRAVPGGCCIEVTEGSSWRTSVCLPKGRYRFGFFYRCFNPGAMKAAAVATSRVDIGRCGSATGWIAAMCGCASGRTSTWPRTVSCGSPSARKGRRPSSTRASAWRSGRGGPHEASPGRGRTSEGRGRVRPERGRPTHGTLLYARDHIRGPTSGASVRLKRTSCGPSPGPGVCRCSSHTPHPTPLPFHPQEGTFAPDMEVSDLV